LVLLSLVYMLILLSFQQLILELWLEALVCALKMVGGDSVGTMIKLDSTNYSI